jgi:hypothetical protein
MHQTYRSFRMVWRSAYAREMLVDIGVGLIVMSQ